LQRVLWVLETPHELVQFIEHARVDRPKDMRAADARAAANGPHRRQHLFPLSRIDASQTAVAAEEILRVVCDRHDLLLQLRLRRALLLGAVKLGVQLKEMGVPDGYGGQSQLGEESSFYIQFTV
jgi:hypothetical protein